MKWRTLISLLGAVVIVAVLAALPFKMEGVTAAPLLQIVTPTPEPPTDTPAPPTNTPVGPTNTPFPTDTPQPTDTPGGPTPQVATPTPISPAQTPRPGGGGVPPGPSGTPAVNGCVRSIGRNGISLGSEPGFYQPHVQLIPRDHLALVLAGPERVDNIWWWRLRAETGAEGWGNQDEMTPDPGPCGGSVSPGLATPPYPVTILPAFSVEQTAVAPVQAVPLEQPAAQVTPTPQEALPQTGNSLDLWFLAGLLAVTVVVVGFVRRRLHAQPAMGDTNSDDAPPTKK